MLDINLSQWTRQDFIDFENRKNEVFQPTIEEQELERLAQIENNKQIIISKLANIGVIRPDIITKDFVLELLTWINAEQYIWNNFDTWIDNQVILFWDLDTAFNELVIRYL